MQWRFVMKFAGQEDFTNRFPNGYAMLLLVFALCTLLIAGPASAAQANSSNKSHSVYDNFNEKWIDPARWLTGVPGCWGLSLECVREIRDGQLNLAARNIGGNDGNSNIQWSQSDLFFPTANRITSITADVTVRGASGTNCPLNPEQASGPDFRHRLKAEFTDSSIFPYTRAARLSPGSPRTVSELSRLGRVLCQYPTSR
jgi:opacity protein-like surface antigen